MNEEETIVSYQNYYEISSEGFIMLTNGIIYPNTSEDVRNGVFGNWDLCMERFPFYKYLPTINPSCCRMSIRSLNGEVIAFEDFCVSVVNEIRRSLDACERDFTHIECGVDAQAYYYFYDY